MDKYLEKVRNAEEVIAGEIVEDRLAEYNDEQRQHAAILLGRAQSADRIAVALSAEVIRFLEHFEETKLYRALGHDRFVDFLSHSGLHSVTKSKYYERKKVLEIEGDMAYDALTLAGIPISTRKELPPGTVEVDGDRVIVKGFEDGDDIIVERENKVGLENAIKQVVASHRKTKERLEFLEHKFEKFDEEIAARDAEIDRVKASKAAEAGSDPHSVALANLVFAFVALREAAQDMALIDRAARKDNVLETIQKQINLTRSCYRTDGTERPVEPAIDEPESLSDDEWFESKFGSVDLNGDNEAELAASL